MFEGNAAKEQLNSAFPEPLIKHATATGLFGGELEFEKMNAFERMIIREVVNISEDVSKFNTDAVRDFTERMGDRGYFSLKSKIQHPISNI
jgi:menaquinone-dependent protoporphyrinogen oxidase